MVPTLLEYASIAETIGIETGIKKLPLGIVTFKRLAKNEKDFLCAESGATSAALEPFYQFST